MNSEYTRKGKLMRLEDTIVLILDDEPASLEESRLAMKEYVKEENIICCTSAVETMRVIESRPVNLAFLDVEMPGTNGFTMSEYIHTKQPAMKYVFLTGHTELGAVSYDYEPFDFLSKPIDIVRLQKTIERYLASQNKSEYKKDMVAVDTSSRFVLLSPEKICYISKENRKTFIHCTDKVFQVQYSLDELEAIFSDYGVFRTHQSFLVALQHVASVGQADFGKTYSAILDDGTKVPVSRNQYAKLREHLLHSGIRFV